MVFHWWYMFHQWYAGQYAQYSLPGSEIVKGASNSN